MACVASRAIQPWLPLSTSRSIASMLSAMAMDNLLRTCSWQTEKLLKRRDGFPSVLWVTETTSGQRQMFETGCRRKWILINSLKRQHLGKSHRQSRRSQLKMNVSWMSLERPVAARRKRQFS